MASALLLNSAAIIIVVGFWAMGVILLYRKLAGDERKACDQPNAAGRPRLPIRSSEPAGPEYAFSSARFEKARRPHPRLKSPEPHSAEATQRRGKPMSARVPVDVRFYMLLSLSLH